MSSAEALGRLIVTIIGIVIFFAAYDHYRDKSGKNGKNPGKDDLKSFIGTKKEWIIAVISIVVFYIVIYVFLIGF